MRLYKLLLAALVMFMWTTSAFAQFNCSYKRGPFPGTCASCQQASQAWYKNQDGSCGACSGWCIPLRVAKDGAEGVGMLTRDDVESLQGQTCTFDRSDGVDAVFYVIEGDTGFVDSIAKVSPLAASALLNFVAYNDIAPPVDMASGQIGFERMPTRDSVAAKAARNWPKANATQLKLGHDTGALVDYRSTRLESGEIALVLSPSLVNGSGARLEPSLPEIEVRLVASKRSPLTVQNIPDRTATVYKLASYKVISR